MQTLVRVVIAVALGLVLGSILTVVLQRVPAPGTMARAETPRVTSTWALLIDAATAGLFVGAVLTFDDPAVATVMAAFFWVMLAVALIDARHRLIPNRIVYPALAGFGVAVTALALAGMADLVHAVVGFAVYGGALLLVALLSGAMGMGDVKLAALIGLVLGAFGLRLVAVAAAVAIVGVGAASILALVVWRRGRKSTIPFGPFLAAGAVVSALVAGPITDTYLRLTA